MNKIMKKYLEQVRNDPTTCIRKKKMINRLLHSPERPERDNYPIMFEDTYFPSFSNAFLYGMDWDFLMMEVLIIAGIEKWFRVDFYNREVFSPFTVGVLIAYLIDCFYIKARKKWGS